MPGIRHVAVGRLGRPHGVGGEVRVDAMGQLPRGLQGYTRFFLGRGGEICPVEIERHRLQGRFVVAKLAGCDTPEEVRRLTGAILYVDRSEMPDLEEGEYYHVDLVGCRVRDEEGVELGRVADVFSSGAHDVLVVGGGDGEWMLPVVSEFVLSIDPAAGEVVARVPEGLRG